jgi:hypothetical protein
VLWRLNHARSIFGGTTEIMKERSPAAASACRPDQLLYMIRAIGF